jgi:hypothetical protein
MGRRGPRPVDIGALHGWEYEWWKAFNHLRDGVELAEMLDPPIEPGIVEARIHAIAASPIEAFFNREPPPANYEPQKSGDPSPRWLWELIAERLRQAEIRRLRTMTPRDVRALEQRRQIWSALWKARTRRGIERACDQWSKLADVRGSGRDVFPAYVVAHVSTFLEITRSPYLPNRPGADESRIDYLARGMAGVMTGRSPMTSIQRLRTLKHHRLGPFWDPTIRRCRCWRCDIDAWRRADDAQQQQKSRKLRASEPRALKRARRPRRRS